MAAASRVLMFMLLIARVVAAQQPAHSTHNPKHGGLFFSIAGDTLHVEAVWPQQRVFKLYVYDEASQPLALERMRQIEGNLEVRGVKIPLVLRNDGSRFDASVPPMSPPATMTLQIRSKKDGEPEGIGLSFVGFSLEDGPSFDLTPTVIPNTLAGLLKAIESDAKEAENLAARGQSAYMFSPALHGRDHLLALDRYLPSLAADRKARAESAIRTAVRYAWLLHSAGDDGSDPQAREAVKLFSRALTEVVGIFRDRNP